MRHFSCGSAFRKRVFGPFTHLGNGRFHQKVGIAPHIPVAVGNGIYALLDGFGKLIGLIDIRSLRIFNVYIDLIRGIVREEFHLGALAAQGGAKAHEGYDQQKEHRSGIPVDIFAPECVFEPAFIEIFQLLQGPSLKTVGGFLDNVLVEPEHTCRYHKQRTQPTDGPSDKEYQDSQRYQDKRYSN